MTIGIDGNEANVAEKVGVSVYTFELLHYFAKHADANTKFVVYLKKPPRPDLPKPDPYFSYQIVRGKYFWINIFLPLMLYKKKNIDIFFSPAHYSPLFCPVPIVVTIHDLAYLHFPDEFLKKDLYKLINWTKWSILKSKKIISVSKYTKNDIVKNYPVKSDKITVISNGYRKSENTTSGRFLKNDYLLHVGTLQPRKNILGLIEAFATIVKKKPGLSLVITGKKGWLYEKIFTKVNSLNLNDKVVFTGYIPDRDLNNLYKNATALVLPSFYEGFGIPVLEAMSNRCPVIAADTSSLPEIGGDACLYFDPSDTIELSETIIKLINSLQLRQELIKKGEKRINQFSWEKCGKETLNLLKTSLIS